jgi:hypothetical protein
MRAMPNAPLDWDDANPNMGRLMTRITENINDYIALLPLFSGSDVIRPQPFWQNHGKFFISAGLYANRL